MVIPVQRSFSSFETGVPCLSPTGSMSCKPTHGQKTQRSPSDTRLRARYWSDGSSHFFPYHSLQQEAQRKHFLCSWCPASHPKAFRERLQSHLSWLPLGFLLQFLAISLKYGLVIMGFPKGNTRVGSFLVTSLTLGLGRQQASWRSWHTDLCSLQKGVESPMTMIFNLLTSSPSSVTKWRSSSTWAHLPQLGSLLLCHLNACLQSSIILYLN